MTLNKLFLTTLLSLLIHIGIIAATTAGNPEEKVVSFRFVPGNDMFYIPWNGNGNELNQLYNLVDEYRTEITSGTMPVYIEGYCSSAGNVQDNLKLARTRSNRVKSELIVHKGLQEKHFITKNHAVAYQGQKDIVIVTLRIPVIKEIPQPQPVSEPEPVQETEPEIEVIQQPDPVVVIQSDRQIGFPPFTIRTNLLYDAFLTPTLGIEWRPNRHIGIKLDGSFAHWGNNHGKVQKMWLISPEVRWYIDQPKQFYIGAGANIGEYNLYKYMPGSFFPDNTGYQGNLSSGGVIVGYQLPLGKQFAIDFNLGLGYTRLKYDSFYLSNEVRVYKEREQTKNFWGPTQAGISLVWRPGMKSEK